MIIRGARQVGKSFLAREFGKKQFEETVEINFEADPAAASLFLEERQQTFGLRYSLQPPEVHRGETTLLSLPHYLVEQQDRIVEAVV